jgi:hypothetical protein
MEMITEESTLRTKGFYWREREGVRALVCGPLEEDGFTNAFSTRAGGVSPMPQDALNLAGFNEDDAQNIYENRRRFLRLFEVVAANRLPAFTASMRAWTITGRSDQETRRASATTRL